MTTAIDTLALYTFLKANLDQEEAFPVGQEQFWAAVKTRAPSARYVHADILEGDTLNVTLYDESYDDINGFEIGKAEDGTYTIVWDDDA